MQDRMPIIETSRLILREIELSDMYDMYEYAHLPYIGPLAGWEPHVNLSHTKSVITAYRNKPKYGDLSVFSVVLKENNKMIGTCELHSYMKNFKAELGYTINPEYWGNGFAVEASIAMLYWGFEKLNLKRIECCSLTTNPRSKKVCEKLGLTYEGIRKKSYMLYDGSINDLECFSITDDEFFKKKQNNEI